MANENNGASGSDGAEIDIAEVRPTDYATVTASESGADGSRGNGNTRARTRANETRDETESAAAGDSVKPTDYTEFQTTQRTPRKSAAKSANNETVQVASLFVLLMSGAATTMIGDYAAFNATEAKMITDGLVRMLTSTNKATLRKVQKFADPIVLLMGFVMWGTRVSAEHRRRATIQAEIDLAHGGPEMAQDITPPNGAVSAEDAHAQAVQTVRNLMEQSDL